MNQLFNISVNGVDVTNIVSDTQVSKEINRFYDVAIITISDNENTPLEAPIVINYGGKTFTGFVYTSSKVGKNTFQLTCRTEGAKLTEPYEPIATATDDATTSHELCALYSSQSGVTIANTAGDLDFGGSYEREGTKISALTNIANVTGAEYWVETNGVIHIAPNIGIDSDGVEVSDGDIFDYIPITKTIYNNGVGYVIVRNGGSISNDVVSLNSVYAEIDECTGKIDVFPNPYGPIEHSEGIGTLTAVIYERTQEISVLDDSVVYLEGAINTVVSVKLNGVEITNFNFEVGHNVMYFSTTQRGTLTVDYTAFAYSGTCDTEITPLGKFISLDLYYLNQLLKFQGFLTDECTIGGVLTDGNMIVITPSEMNYVAGYNFWTIGGTPSFHYFNRSQEITRYTESLVGDYIAQESVNLQVDETNGGYYYKTRYIIKSVTNVRSSGDEVAYTVIQVDGEDVIHVEQYYPSMEITYTVEANRWFTKFDLIPNSEGDIRMVVINEETGNPFEYQLSEQIPCVLDQTYYVNVAQELGVELFDAVGRVVWITHPDASKTSDNVDSEGRVGVYLNVDGLYKLDTNEIKYRSYVELTVNTGMGA